jgi:hypothetical protein
LDRKFNFFFQIVVGWCVAHFGLFGTKRQSVDSPILNYLGVLLTLFSGLMFVFVYSQEEENKNDVKISPNMPLNTINHEHRENCGGGREYGSVTNVWSMDSTGQQHPAASGNGTTNETIIDDITEATVGRNNFGSDLPWAKRMNLNKRKLL